ncbi:hypothetical protein Slin14017_G097360 [Septoria linicola]|nr:hypothetical protein Slin14017_G097360 [Septoria linicola]
MPTSYQREDGTGAAQLYKAKHKISVLALCVHLLKVSYHATTPSNPLVRTCVDVAVGILREQDIREPGNPALRWPLTILACAAQQEDEFRFLVGRMSEIEAILDLSNSSKIKLAIEFLTQHRAQELPMPLYTDRGPWMPTTQLDFLLEPQLLEGAKSPGS